MKKQHSLFNSRLFAQNFLYIGSIMLLFFAAFSLITYKRSMNIMTREFTASAENQLSITAKTVDTQFSDSRYIIATLHQNKLVNAFFSMPHPEQLYDEIEVRLTETLKSFVNSNAAIDSIYLYSSLSDQAATNIQLIPLPLMQDDNWISYLTPEAEGENIILVSRQKNDRYPFLLSMIQYWEKNGNKAAIILNLDFSRMSPLTNVSSNPYQHIYLVTDDNQVMYRRYQQELLEPLADFPLLTNLKDTSALTSAVISTGSGSCILAQIHAQNAPWYYVTVTNLDVYSQKLSSNTLFLIVFFAALLAVIVLISFLFSFHSTKPTYKLMEVLEHPEIAFSKPALASNEIQYISEHIVSYAQRNQELSDELTKRLNLLNDTKMLALQSQINPHFLFNTINMIYLYECDELGYQHKIPLLTLKLSRILKYAFQSTDLVSLSTELDFVKTYLALMQERYNNLFQVIYDVNPDLLSIEVPKLFIQPLIENSIFHGLAKCQKKDAALTIRICKASDRKICGKEAKNTDTNTEFKEISKEEKCMIVVEDNGIGIDTITLEKLRNIIEEEMPQSTSVGLRNVVIRMKLLYGNSFSFTIDSEVGKGSSFTLMLPKSS